MRVNCGTDVIEIERIQKAIENIGENFLQTIFTQNEIEYCESKKVQKYQHYAARFAAKEAAYKALGEHLSSEFHWKLFEVLKQENGKPELKLNGTIHNLKSVDISISHCKLYAVANVVAIFED